MPIDLNEDNLKHGILGLVIALVEIIRDVLKLQAIKRMEGGRLDEEEIERLGEALRELDTAIEEIKKEQGVSESVRSVREGLDSIVDDLLATMVTPDRLEEADNKKTRIQKSGVRSQNI